MALLVYILVILITIFVHVDLLSYEYNLWGLV